MTCFCSGLQLHDCLQLNVVIDLGNFKEDKYIDALLAGREYVNKVHDQPGEVHDQPGGGHFPSGCL